MQRHKNNTFKTGVCEFRLGVSMLPKSKSREYDPIFDESAF